MSTHFIALKQLLGLINDENGKLEIDNENNEPVLIRTPLARKKVYENELWAEIWYSIRSFLSNTRIFPASFVEFWALHAISDVNDKILSDMLLQSQSSKGISVCDVVEGIKLYIKHKLCNAYDQIVEDYTTMMSTINEFPRSCVRSSFRATRNGRTHMEDYCIIMEDILHPKCNKIFSLYIVFDGHNGSETALFASKHLPFFILKCHDPFNRFAIRESFLYTQSLIEQRFVQNQKISGGSTVVLVLACENFAHIAWLGDSVAFCIHDQSVTFKTLPHKPNRKDEFERIQRNGGCVTRGNVFRINGLSSVSRALGDMSLKPLISHEPEQEIIDISNLDAILLGTDGFAEFCSNSEIIDIVYGASLNQHVDSVCSSLVERAQHNRSDDNIMVLLIYKQWPVQSTALTHILHAELGKKSVIDEKSEYISAINRPLSAIVNLRKKSSTSYDRLNLSNEIRPYSNLL